MICPKCGKEMILGNIQRHGYGSRGTLRFMDKDEQEKKGIFAKLNKRSYRIETFENTVFAPVAYHCPDCHKVYAELNVEDRSYWDENY